ncbi:MAG: hypothetical protein JWM80_6138, partial [Cyanobacteria bacterium RYN_339]|nr:hypothetical protein [Cyanobacteria bacterium RYN_339]
VGQRAVTVEVERFDGHDPTCRAACERYAAFLGLPLAPHPG